VLLAVYTQGERDGTAGEQHARDRDPATRCFDKWRHGFPPELTASVACRPSGGQGPGTAPEVIAAPATDVCTVIGGEAHVVPTAEQAAASQRSAHALDVANGTGRMFGCPAVGSVSTIASTPCRQGFAAIALMDARRAGATALVDAAVPCQEQEDESQTIPPVSSSAGWPVRCGRCGRRRRCTRAPSVRSLRTAVEGLDICPAPGLSEPPALGEPVVAPEWVVDR
jgi:hypothetical protein